jgi:hypothetical protein
MHSLGDAAFPTDQLLAFDAVAGYLGPDHNAVHPWTPAEWQKYQNKRWLPIWVYDPALTGRAQAGMCLLALHSLGIKPKVRRWWTVWRTLSVVVSLDLETLKAVIADTEFTAVLGKAGFLVMPYGSKSTVYSNPPGFGYWVADWTSRPHMVPGRYVKATQWTSGSDHDSSLIRWRLWVRLWKP